MAEGDVLAEGVVEFVNIRKGYGFISLSGKGKDSGDETVFASSKQAPSGALVEGAKVRFSVAEGPIGKEARDIKPV